MPDPDPVVRQRVVAPGPPERAFATSAGRFGESTPRRHHLAALRARLTS